MQHMFSDKHNLREIDRQIASVVLISSDDRILLGRKDPHGGGVYPNAWHIPGGGVDEGESLEDAAKREALEEVGIDLAGQTLRLLPFVGHGESPKQLGSGEKVWCNMTFSRFEVRLPQKAQAITTSPGDDLVELQWFSKPEISELELVPGGRDFFIEAGYLPNA